VLPQKAAGQFDSPGTTATPVQDTVAVTAGSAKGERREKGRDNRHGSKRQGQRYQDDNAETSGSPTVMYGYDPGRWQRSAGGAGRAGRTVSTQGGQSPAPRPSMAAASASRSWAAGPGLRYRILWRRSGSPTKTSELCSMSHQLRRRGIADNKLRSRTIEPPLGSGFPCWTDRLVRPFIAWTPAFLCGRGQPGQSTLRTTLWSWPARRVCAFPLTAQVRARSLPPDGPDPEDSIATEGGARVTS